MAVLACAPSLILIHFYHCLVSFFISAENIMQGQSNVMTLKHLQLKKDGKSSRLTALITPLLHSMMFFQLSTISSQRGE